MTNINKVAPKEKMIPFVGKVKTNLDKRIEHVQAGLKADQKVNGTKRPLNEFAELANLIGDQFDDDTYNIKQEVINVG